MPRPRLTARQEIVSVTLYVRYGWSAKLIARTTGCGRRAIENALRRRGVTLKRHGTPIWRDGPGPSIEAARQWFADAARPERADDLMGFEVQFVSNERGTKVYRRRRCQNCYTLTKYSDACPRCGEPLDYYREPDLDRQAREAREEDEQR